MEGEECLLYYMAADIIHRVKLKQGTAKTLIYASAYKNIKQLFALVNECIKYGDILKDVASKCPEGLLSDSVFKGNKDVAVVFLYEHLMGRKFGRAVHLRKLFQPFKKDIKSAVDKVLEELGAKTLQEARQKCGDTNTLKIPRYMRVNLIKSSVDEAVKDLQDEGWYYVGVLSQDGFVKEVSNLTKFQFGRDPVLHDLLVFPPETDLHAHIMTRSGTLVQQDRASCIPAHALDPVPGSVVVDSCAAPGNKTSHLASLMNNQGRIVALDRDLKRLGTMSKLLGNSDASCIELVHQDFLTVQPDSDDAGQISYILVDPSCSGSGMLSNQMMSQQQEMSDPQRINTLKRFQISILKHALKFPNTRRVVYSTCSVHKEENEEVAEEVMSQVKDEFKFVKVLPEWLGSRGHKEFPHGAFFLRTNSSADLTQGFFVACFERLGLEDAVVAEEFSNLVTKKRNNKVLVEEDQISLQDNKNEKKKRKKGCSTSGAEISDIASECSANIGAMKADLISGGNRKEKRRKRTNSSESLTETGTQSVIDTELKKKKKKNNDLQ